MTVLCLGWRGGTGAGLHLHGGGVGASLGEDVSGGFTGSEGDGSVGMMTDGLICDWNIISSSLLMLEDNRF